MQSNNLISKILNYSSFLTHNEGNAKPENESPWKTLAYTASALGCAALALAPVAAGAQLIPIALRSSFLLFIPAAIGCQTFVKKAIESYKLNVAQQFKTTTASCLKQIKPANKKMQETTQFKTILDSAQVKLANEKKQEISLFKTTIHSDLDQVKRENFNDETKIKKAANILHKAIDNCTTELELLKGAINEIFESRNDFDFNQVLNLVQNKSKEFPYIHEMFL